MCVAGQGQDKWSKVPWPVCDRIGGEQERPMYDLEHWPQHRHTHMTRNTHMLRHCVSTVYRGCLATAVLRAHGAQPLGPVGTRPGCIPAFLLPSSWSQTLGATTQLRVRSTSRPQRLYFGTLRAAPETREPRVFLGALWPAPRLHVSTGHIC